MKNLSIIAAFTFLLFTACLYSQTDSLKKDTQRNIPELEDFHNIIYPVWHTFYPAKDYKSLREITPELNQKAESIYNVKLPGILREKVTKWNEGVSAFRKAVDDYNTIAKGTDDKGLLNAAEILHSKYEMLVRIINPDLKEAEEFHQLLYVIYHKYLPEKDYNNINLLTPQLVTKAEAITKAKLPKRFEKKSDQFKIAADNLLASVNELKLISAGADNPAINKAVEKMHSNYEKLNEVFSN